MPRLVNMKSLIVSGSIQPGDILIWHRRSLGETIELSIDSSGRLKANDGKVFGTPTAAAKNFNGGIAINGWRVWKIKRTGQSLDDLRKNHSLNNG